MGARCDEFLVGEELRVREKRRLETQIAGLWPKIIGIGQESVRGWVM